jgi:hypothetical protein
MLMPLFLVLLTSLGTWELWPSTISHTTLVSMKALMLVTKDPTPVVLQILGAVVMSTILYNGSQLMILNPGSI